MIDLDRPPSSTQQRSAATARLRGHKGATAPVLPPCRTRSRVLLLGAIMTVPLLCAGAVVAQVEDTRPQQTPLQRVEAPLAEQGVEDEPDYGSALSVSVGSTFTSEYWFRGFLQENQGVIAQPYAELGVGLVAPEDERYSLDATIGIWNSLHSEKTGATGAGPSTWYESDVYGGLTFTTGNLEVGAIYTFYTYPNGAASTIQELGLYTGYTWGLAGDADRDDDVDLWLGLGGGVFFETADGGGSEDAYAELNIEPGLDFEVRDGLPITVSFPVTAGFSIDDYYFDAAGGEETLGYVSAAVAAGMPLPVPAEYGQWTLSGAVTGVFLTADSLTAIDGADDSNVFGSLTIDIAF